MRKPRATKPAPARAASWKAAGLNKPAGGSSFVSCPACGRSIHHALINTHLDSCQVGQAAQQVPQQARVQLKASSNGTSSHGASSAAGAASGAVQQGSQTSSGPNAGQLWPVFQQGGKSRPGGPAAATAYYPDGRQRQLTAEQLFGITPCELVPAFLPASLATEVLQLLMTDQAQFQRMQWWMGSTAEPAQSSKSSRLYLLAQRSQAGTQVGAPSGGASSASSSSSSSAADTHGDAGSLELQQLAPAALQRAGELVAAAVNERIGSGRAARLPLEVADRGGWAPSYAIANCYSSGAEGVGPHSDRLTPLGPLPIIASLSLGATRTSACTAGSSWPGRAPGAAARAASSNQ